MMRYPRRSPAAIKLLQGRLMARRGSAVALSIACAATTACTPPVDRSMEIRQWTDDMAFRISVTPTPPVAELDAVYKVVVQDKETGQPIETGEGRLFASNEQQVSTADGLAKGKEVGTYYARLRFPVSGEWAIGLQFRRAPGQPLERTQDWRQGVLSAPPLGTKKTP